MSLSVPPPESPRPALPAAITIITGIGADRFSAGVCQITIHADHVRLAFIHGAFLPDPKGLLEGDSLYKRFIKLTSYDLAPWEDLKDIIIHSSRFDPRTLQFR